jgi:hypothetical protein
LPPGSDWLLIRSRSALSSKFKLFDQRVKRGDHGQRQYGRRNHATDHRCGNATHHFRASAGPPHDGQQARHDGNDRHHLGTNPREFRLTLSSSKLSRSINWFWLRSRSRIMSWHAGTVSGVVFRRRLHGMSGVHCTRSLQRGVQYRCHFHKSTAHDFKSRLHCIDHPMWVCRSCLGSVSIAASPCKMPQASMACSLWQR